MKWLGCLVTALLLAGCASSGQSFESLHPVNIAAQSSKTMAELEACLFASLRGSTHLERYKDRHLIYFYRSNSLALITLKANSAGTAYEQRGAKFFGSDKIAQCADENVQRVIPQY